ncbi:hypothetical protein BaRGS_00024860 [Batillaria attramentaria]|uniref:Uncharacterized protein n=1 Tax=Batillaria attramentaria TaxID=370345 RepID=A0ABD0KA32_9CAEN
MTTATFSNLRQTAGRKQLKSVCKWITIAQSLYNNTSIPALSVKMAISVTILTIRALGLHEFLTTQPATTTNREAEGRRVECEWFLMLGVCLYYMYMYYFLSHAAWTTCATQLSTFRVPRWPDYKLDTFCPTALPAGGSCRHRGNGGLDQIKVRGWSFHLSQHPFSANLIAYLTAYLYKQPRCGNEALTLCAYEI